MVMNFYTTKFIQKLNNQILKLDPKHQFNLKRFLNLQFFGSITIFILGLMFDLTPLISLLFALIYGYMLYYMGVLKPLKKRTLNLEHDAIIFFETLALSLQSGANLDVALSVSVDNTDSQLSSEFKRTLMDIKFGKTLEEGLLDMTKRIPSSIINNTIINIHQSLKLGSSITDNLYEQINYLQEVEIANIKKLANTIPTKISIVSVILFIPLVLLLILAPVLLTLIK